jgi:NAD(P)H-nitrite reductase large subunit
MALCTVGVYPNTDFLEGSGIEVDEVTGAISVNTFLQTNLEGIYAAGSCALVNGQIAYNWLLSAEQGRIAGLNMVGHEVAYDTPWQGDLDTRLYDLPFAYFGQNRPASPDIQLWSWENGSRQFAQVLLDGDCVVGATLLGDIVEAGAELFKRYRAQAPTSKDDLQVILFGVRA